MHFGITSPDCRAAGGFCPASSYFVRPSRLAHRVHLANRTTTLSHADGTANVRREEQGQSDRREAPSQSQESFST